MRRVAFCSPVNPAASGIADYAEELLPFLAQWCEVELFVAPGLVPTNPLLAAHLAVWSLDHLASRHAARPYDAIVYQMGNSPAHNAIYELLLRVPGVMVLHDWVLHHFKLGYLAAHNRLASYHAELARLYGRPGERAGRRMLQGQLTDAVFAMPLNDDVLAAARGVIGHSRWIVEQIAAAQPNVPAAWLPMGVPLPPLFDRAAARQALGLAVDAPVWASFGHVNPYKRSEAALRAFRHFRETHPTARYLFVGSVSPNYPLAAVVARLGLTDAVTITGYVSAAAWAAYVAAADLCLNLRHPTAGETSASLLRLLGAGRPTLVSAGDAFAELPDHVCAKVDADAGEAALIFEYAQLLDSTPALALALGANARAFVAREHTLSQAAAEYMRFLAQIYGWEAPTIQRPPLWTLPVVAALPVAVAPPVVAAAGAAPFAGVGDAVAALGVAPDDAALGDIAAVAAGLWG